MGRVSGKQTVKFDWIDEFAERHRLEVQVARIQKIPPLRNGSGEYGNPPVQQIKKAYILGLFDGLGLLDEYYKRYCASFLAAPGECERIRRGFDDCRDEYESQIDEFLKPDERTLYEEIKRQFALPESSTNPTIACDIGEPTQRITAAVNRIIRDTPAAKELKRKYSFMCQVCAVPLPCGNGQFYVEVHHLRPLGRPHDGPDNHQNMLVLCPNCHALFDLAVPRFVDNQSVEINGRMYKLIFRSGHMIATENIAYYTKNICGEVA